MGERVGTWLRLITDPELWATALPSVMMLEQHPNGGNAGHTAQIEVEPQGKRCDSY